MNSADADCSDLISGTGYEAYASDPIDCCDTDPRAYPGQWQVFTTPRTGGCAATYDFDCNGVTTREWDWFHTDCGVPTSCNGGGWNTDWSVSCGTTEQWVNCALVAGSCVAQFEDRTQACR